MNPLTRRDVVAHQAAVPWPSQRQVEQDLLLCQAMTALFNDKFLRTQIAMRGGTLLHKVHLAPAARYSEDIDLVVFGDRPENHIAKAIRRVLRDVLGKPTDSVWDTIQLAIRNVVRPSRVLRLTYSVPAVSEPGAYLDIVVETNVTERTPHRAIVQIPFEFTFRETAVKSVLNGYDLHEMLGTKCVPCSSANGDGICSIYTGRSRSPTRPSSRRRWSSLSSTTSARKAAAPVGRNLSGFSTPIWPTAAFARI